ncbi:MAG: GntR family transcriptional regulator [Pseudomonadota bacterium]|jgi:DNA-binding GntR family transcriptional regulator
MTSHRKAQLAAHPAIDGAETLTAAARKVLAEAIVSGHLKPGAKLGVRELAIEFGFGPTPLREALTGLTSQGLVTFAEQRGFRVADVSREDLLDLVATRNVVECGALRIAIAEGDVEWEAGVVAALHRMKSLLTNFPPPGPEASHLYESVNESFHFSLIATRRPGRMAKIYFELFEQTRRYRTLMLEQHQMTLASYEAHRVLAETCLARDVERACALLVEHNMMVFKLIYGD